MPSTKKPVRVFISFASDSSEDTGLVNELIKHLSPLKRKGLISYWWRESVLSGENWGEEVMRHLYHADIILLMISSDFISSDFCYHVEMQKALQRYEIEGICLIPLLLRPIASWRTEPFGQLKVLPSTEEALTSWRDRDKAFVNVVSGITKVVEELRITSLTQPGSLIWNVPYYQNPLFIGREIYFEKLYTQFFGENTQRHLKCQALCGLGGIGKTQIAIEYAYRYCDNYKAVFWIRAEAKDTLLSEFSKLAVLLGITEERKYPSDSFSLPLPDASSHGVTISSQTPFNGREQGETRSLPMLSLDDAVWTSHARLNTIATTVSPEHRLIQVVKEWFHHHSNWLLIFDNVDHPGIIQDFLPWSQEGHILLTTQSQSTVGIAEPIKIEKMRVDESIHLLFSRSQTGEDDAMVSPLSQPLYKIAQEIVELMGGNPLALDQAGAYIEITDCGLPAYLSLYKKRHAELLRMRAGPDPDHPALQHPASIATTLSLCFGRLQNATKDSKINKAAVELLQLCAFLDPEQIPEKIITIGASEFKIPLQEIANDALKLDMAIQILRKFSLIERNPDANTLTLHRLVKTILQNEMDKKAKKKWAIYAIKAVGRTVIQSSTEVQKLYFLQMQICIGLIEDYQLAFLEAAQLLYSTGNYYKEEVNYEKAELLLKRALKMYEDVLGPVHPDGVSCIDSLAEIYYIQNKPKEAEPLLQQALTIREHHLGQQHFHLVNTLDNLAEVSSRLGKYQVALSLCQRALTIREREQGSEHPEIVSTLNKLAGLHSIQGEYVQAMSLFQRVLNTLERLHGSGHPNTAQSLNNLGILNRTLSKYTEAETLFQTALTILEGKLGNEHVDTAVSLDNLARLYYLQDKYELAETFFQRSLAIRERLLGSEHPDTAQNMNNIALLYRAQGKYQEAEALFLHSLEIRRRVFDNEHPDIAQSLNNLGILYRVQGKYNQAEEQLSKALNIYEKLFGNEHPGRASVLNELAILYRIQKRYELAIQIAKQALFVREKLLGSEHPNTAQSDITLASIYRERGEYTQAEQLLWQARTIYEKVLGSEHSNTASSIDSLAILYLYRNQYTQAKKLFMQALAIREKVLGSEHLDIAGSFNNLAAFYVRLGEFTRAGSYYTNALNIYEKIVGHEHPTTVAIQKKYTALLTRQANQKK